MTTVDFREGDFRDLIADLADESIDLIIADPPYGQTSLEWDRWVVGWPNLLRRLLKPTGSMWVFGTLRMFLSHADEFASWKFAQDMVWEKHNGSSFHTDRFRRVHEQIAQFYRKDAAWSEVWKHKVTTPDATKRTIRRKQRPAHMGRINEGHYVAEDGGPRIMRSVIFAKSEHGRAIHPTQKPIAIVEPLILSSCPPKGLILDPFGGSGTTALAARRTGRSAIVMEIDAKMYTAAKHRFEAELI